MGQDKADGWDIYPVPKQCNNNLFRNMPVYEELNLVKKNIEKIN